MRAPQKCVFRICIMLAAERTDDAYSFARNGCRSCLNLCMLIASLTHKTLRIGKQAWHNFPRDTCHPQGFGWLNETGTHLLHQPGTRSTNPIHSSDLLRILLINLFVQNWMGVWRGDWHQAHYIGVRGGGRVSKIGFVLWFYLISLIMGVRIYDVVVTFYVGRMSHQSDLIVLWRNYISS